MILSFSFKASSYRNLLISASISALDGCGRNPWTIDMSCTSFFSVWYMSNWLDDGLIWFLKVIILFFLRIIYTSIKGVSEKKMVWKLYRSLPIIISNKDKKKMNFLVLYLGSESDCRAQLWPEFPDGTNFIWFDWPDNQSMKKWKWNKITLCHGANFKFIDLLLRLCKDSKNDYRNRAVELQCRFL